MASEFGKQVEEWAQKVEAALTETFREAVIEIGSRLIDTTPDEDGRTAGSWESTVNGPSTGAAPIRDAAAAKAELRTIAASLTIGDTANITSNLDRIRAIEYGDSQNAPRGMLRFTEQQWQEIVNEAAAKAKAKYGL